MAVNKKVRDEPVVITREAAEICFNILCITVGIDLDADDESTPGRHKPDILSAPIRTISPTGQKEWNMRRRALQSLKRAIDGTQED